MRGVGVVVAHHDPAAVRALADAIDAAADLYVAATDPSADVPAAVTIVGGSVLYALTSSSRPVIALADPGEEIRAARAALALGATEIVRWPSEAYRLPNAVRLAATSTDTGQPGGTVAVIGARGGCGTTTAALAFALLAGGIAVDLAGGALDVLIDEPQPYPPLEIAAADVIDGALERLGDGARVLRATRMPADHLAAVRAVRSLAAAVIVDAGRDVAACAAADRVVVSCADDVISARGLRAIVEAGVTPALVLVRRERRAGVAARDVAAAAGDVPCTVVPRDGSLARALDLGRWPARPTRAMRALGRAWAQVRP